MQRLNSAGADLTGAESQATRDLTGACLRNAKLDQARIHNTILRNADLTGVLISNEQITVHGSFWRLCTIAYIGQTIGCRRDRMSIFAEKILRSLSLDFARLSYGSMSSGFSRRGSWQACEFFQPKS
jgi:uncharacterized protein YjbI with pentapeptide repeats